MKLILCVVVLSLVLASSLSAQDTVRVKAGWNIIGWVKAGAVPDVLSTNPDSLIVSSFFGYAPGVGYESTDTLGKGLGYWVKVKEDGIIIFNTAPAIDSCASKAFAYQGKFYNTVSVGDQCWMAQNLDVWDDDCRGHPSERQRHDGEVVLRRRPAELYAVWRAV